MEKGVKMNFGWGCQLWRKRMGEECCLFVCVEQSVWVVVRVEGEVVNWFGILGKGVRKRTLAREMNNSAAAVVRFHCCVCPPEKRQNVKKVLLYELWSGKSNPSAVSLGTQTICISTTLMNNLKIF